jgi:hypothetical protein
LIGGIIGEYIIAPVIDMAAPYVARIFADEAGATLKNAIGAAGDAGGDALPADLAQMVKNVNPTGGTMNCVNCAIALDNTLAGNATSAMPGGAVPLSLARFTPATADSIASELADAGAGARGIVVGSNGAGTVGHAFNAVNFNGAVYFLDGQAGSAASTAYRYLYFLRTF